MSWGCVRRTLLAFRAGFRSGGQMPETYFKVPQKIVRYWTSSMQLKTAGSSSFVHSCAFLVCLR